MNVLIVSQYFWPENFRINDLALGLKERGHSVTVLTGIPNYPAGKVFSGYGYFKKLREDVNGLKVLRVPLIPRGRSGSLRLVLNYLSFAFCASIIGPFICRGNIDLIFVFEVSPITVGIPALVLKKAKSAPVMFWVLDLWPESLSATGAIKSRFILSMVDNLVKFIYHGCDLILTSSKGFRSNIEKYGVRSETIRYFPQSVESIYQRVVVAPDAPERLLMKNGFNVVFAGNIGAAQDFETILSAAELMRSHGDIIWTIIGDGRMFDWVKSEVAKRNLGSTVILLGRYPLNAMPIFFSLADVLLVTLKREPIFSLTVPAKVQSYFACGRPVIACLDGEGSGIVDEACAGLTCQAESPTGLAKAVIQMYEMPKNEREIMGMNGRKYYETNFDREVLLDKLGVWIKELLVDDQS